MDKTKQVNQKTGLLSQPKAVWAVAFACVISFMGIGLVDPILPAIAAQLHASPSEVSLLFTSYLLVTGFMMFFSGAISSRIGAKWTLILGLIFIIVFAALGGSSSSIAQLVGYRGGWGLGNALFISTALAVIVGVSVGGAAQAIILYEATARTRDFSRTACRRRAWKHLMARAVLRGIGPDVYCVNRDFFHLAEIAETGETCWGI